MSDPESQPLALSQPRRLLSNRTSYRVLIYSVVALNIIALFPLQYLSLQASWGEIDLLSADNEYFGYIAATPTGFLKSRSCWRLKSELSGAATTDPNADEEYKSCRKYMFGLGRQFYRSWRHRCTGTGSNGAMKDTTGCASLKKLMISSLVSTAMTVIGILCLVASAALLVRFDSRSNF